MSTIEEEVLALFARIEATNEKTPVLVVLNSVGNPTLGALQASYLDICGKVHPHKGGKIDKARATDATRILNRAYQQVERQCSYDYHVTHDNLPKITDKTCYYTSKIGTIKFQRS